MLMGTASLVLGTVLIGIGVYVFLVLSTDVTQVVTMWGTGYRFATLEELGVMIIVKFFLTLIFLTSGVMLLRKYDSDKKKEI